MILIKGNRNNVLVAFKLKKSKKKKNILFRFVLFASLFLPHNSWTTKEPLSSRMLSPLQQWHKIKVKVENQRQHKNKAQEISTLKQSRKSRDFLNWWQSPTCTQLSPASKRWGALLFMGLWGGLELMQDVYRNGPQLPPTPFLMAPWAKDLPVSSFFQTHSTFAMFDHTFEEPLWRCMLLFHSLRSMCRSLLASKWAILIKNEAQGDTILTAIVHLCIWKTGVYEWISCQYDPVTDGLNSWLRESISSLYQICEIRQIPGSHFSYLWNENNNRT